jgi:hypothetical protein
MRAEAARYREAARGQTAEYMKAVLLGKAATATGRRTGRHGFGGSRSQTRRSQRALQMSCMALQMQAWAADPAAASLALAVYGRASDATVPEILSVARRADRVQANLLREAGEANDKALVTYQENIGRDVVQAVRQAVPELAAFPMEAEAGAPGYHVRVDLPGVEEVKAAVGWACENTHASGLAVRLEAWWELLHRTLLEADCPATGPVAAPGRCFAAGMCLCCDAGRALDRRATRLVNHVKAVCPPHSPRRADLLAGRLLVRLIGRPAEYEDLIEGDEPIVDVWYHLGLVNLSPFEPIFHVLEPVGDPGEVAPMPQRVYARSGGKFLRLHQGMEPLRESSTIWSRWYALEEADRPVAQFKLDQVPLLELPGHRAARRIWPRAEAVARGARAGRSRVASAAEQAAGGEGPPDEASDAEAGDEPEEAEPPLAFVDLLEPLLEAFESSAPMVLGQPGSDAPDDGALPAPNAPEAQGVPSGSQSGHAAAGAARAGKRRQPPGRDELTVVLPHGLITFYPSNGYFEAKCAVHAGERCTLSRRSAKAAGGSREKPGSRRPLGLLAAWLDVGPFCAAKGEHKAPDTLSVLGGPESREHRLQCRQQLAAAPGADDLLALEAPAEGEGLDGEPMAVP